MPRCPQWSDRFEFVRDIANVISPIKFCVSQFRAFGAVKPQIWLSSYDWLVVLATVSRAVLHCDTVYIWYVVMVCERLRKCFLKKARIKSNDLMQSHAVGVCTIQRSTRRTINTKQQLQSCLSHATTTTFRLSA